MFTPDDLKPLSTVIGSAAAVGLALGLWLALPADRPASAAVPGDDAQPVSQVDPNLARYQAMAAANGVDAVPYILAPGYDAPAQTVADATPQEDTTTVVDDDGAVAQPTEPASTPTATSTAASVPEPSGDPE